MKFIALTDGVGYEKDTIFTPVSLKDVRFLSVPDEEHDVYFTPENLKVPIFHELALERSPDFDEIKEPREPENSCEFFAIGSRGDLFDNEESLSENLTVNKWIIDPADSFWENLKDESFLTESDADACLVKVIALIKEESKESRSLDK
jgi:hypothetical protein